MFLGSFAIYKLSFAGISITKEYNKGKGMLKAYIFDNGKEIILWI